MMQNLRHGASGKGGGKVGMGCMRHCVRAYADCRTSLSSKASLGLSTGLAHPAPRPAAAMPPYRPRIPSRRSTAWIARSVGTP